MQYTAFRLAFRSPVHIGSNRPGFEHTERYIHSDTLFSALMQSWSVLFPHDLERFFSDGEEPSVTFPYFQISSAFPWIGENYFFPRPYRSTGPLAVGEPSPRRAKQIKRLVWLEQSLFEAWLNGSPPEFKPEETFGDGVFWSPGQKEGENDKSTPFRTEDSVRIIMNRNTNETTPFYFTRLFFAPNAGLFFLARFKDDSWRKKFTAALRLLGDEGLGGDRSVGHGQFVVQTAADIEVQHPEESNFSLALSLIHPGPGEFNPIGRNSSYGITNRMGWITAGYGRPLRRQAVRMVEEGSVLEGWRGKGDLVRVLDKNSVSGMPHSVYRYGNAFTLPIRIGKRRTHA